MKSVDRKELFETMPVSKALASMAIPTVISQLINLVYNVVDAFYIGRTGNSYMVAAASLTLSITMMLLAFSNIFSVGGGSLVARLSGAGNTRGAQQVSAFSFYGALVTGLLYSTVVGVFLNPLLICLGASPDTLGYARQYVIFIIVLGSVPNILALTQAHLLRNVGYAKQASIGISSGGVLNIILDPLFMFVLLPEGNEVMGAAIATLLSNVFACLYLLFLYRKVTSKAPLSLSIRRAAEIDRANVARLFSVGIPSAVLTGLFDVANIVLNMLCAAHGDLTLAAIGIVMKIERIPNAINMGITQGMLPMVAYNYSSGNTPRMKKIINTARIWGLLVSAVCILSFEFFASGIVRIFMSTNTRNVEQALLTVGLAVAFLRIRCMACPFQFVNFHSSYCMQAMGHGGATMLHSVVRQIMVYIPCMFLLNKVFGVYGLISAFVVGEGAGALFAMILLTWIMKKAASKLK